MDQKDIKIIQSLTNVLALKAKTQVGQVDGKITVKSLPSLVLEGMTFLRDEVKSGSDRKKILLDVLGVFIPKIIVSGEKQLAKDTLLTVIPTLIDTLAFTSKAGIALTTSSCWC